MVDTLKEQFIDLTEKVHDLEVSSAYQEDVIEHLNKTIGQRHQDIQQLQTQIRLLSDLLKTIKNETGSGIKLPSEEIPPPHY